MLTFNVNTCSIRTYTFASNNIYMLNFFKKKLILVGSRNNLSDIIEAAKDSGYHIIGILDKHYWGNTEKINGISVIGSEDELLDPS